MKKELVNALSDYQKELCVLSTDIIGDELYYIDRDGAYRYVEEDHTFNELNILFVNILKVFENIINAYNDVKLYGGVLNDNVIIHKVVKLNNKYNAKICGSIRAYKLEYMSIYEIENTFDELCLELYNDEALNKALDDVITSITNKLDKEE